MGKARCACRAQGGPQYGLRISRRLVLENDEHAQMLVRAEAMVGSGFNEDGASQLNRHVLAFDL
jgi:hypothetical protein